MLHSDLLLDGDGWMKADEKSIKVFLFRRTKKTRQFNEILIVMKILSIFLHLKKLFLSDFKLNYESFFSLAPPPLCLVFVRKQ